MIGSRAELLSLLRPWLLIVSWSLMLKAAQVALNAYSAATGWPYWTFFLVIIVLLPVFSALGWARRKMGAKPWPFRLPWFKPFFMWRENDGALNPFQYIWRFVLAFGLPIWLLLIVYSSFGADTVGEATFASAAFSIAIVVALSAPIGFMFWEESHRRATEKESQAE